MALIMFHTHPLHSFFPKVKNLALALIYILSSSSDHNAIDFESVPGSSLFAMATLAPVNRLANKFRSSILNLDPNSNENSPGSNKPMTDSARGSGEFRGEDYVDTVDPTTIDHLRRIATEMKSAGYLHECIHIFISVRSSFVAASFQKLEVQKLSQLTAQTMNWGSLESIIRNWNQSAIICIKFLFLHEKQLCHQIFHGLGNAAEDDCFVETVKETATQLFDIAETLCLCSIHPHSDKLFRILDVYQTLSSLLPLINDLFSSESSKWIQVRPSDQLLPKLAHVIQCILADFERYVLQYETTFLTIEDVHPLSTHVMRKVRRMCDYKQTLMVLILSKPSTGQTGVTDEIAEYEGQTPLSLHLISIVMRLLSNLEAKSNLYEASWASFFILINLDYIVRGIEKNQQLRELIGDEYLMKLTSQLRQVKAEYVSLTFDKILYCLQAEGPKKGCGIFSSSEVKKMTKRLKSFNDRFARAQHDHANLACLDSLLLEELQKLIKEKLNPAYSSFLEQFLEQLKNSGKPSAEKHIRYSVQDLESAISNFFYFNH